MKIHQFVMALVVLVGFSSFAEVTVAAQAEDAEGDVGAEEFELRAATPPGGSWNRTCRPGRSIPGGYCAVCRRRDGSYAPSPSCIYTRRCRSWCAWNEDGTLKCGNC